MTKPILIGVDGREGSRDALSLAERLAPEGAELIAVCVATSGTRNAEPHLRHALSSFPQVSARSYVATSVGDGLHQLALEEDAAMIVLGASHHGRVGRTVLGNHARRSMHHAPCPVVIAPHGYAAAPWSIGTIGVGHDGSAAADAALAAAHGLGARSGATVRVVELVDRRPSVAYAVACGSIENAEKRELQLVRDRLVTAAGPDARVLTDEAVAGLRKLAAEVDLLVVGRDPHPHAARVLLGSVSDGLVADLPAALMVVPGPA